MGSSQATTGWLGRPCHRQPWQPSYDQRFFSFFSGRSFLRRKIIAGELYNGFQWAVPFDKMFLISGDGSCGGISGTSGSSSTNGAVLWVRGYQGPQTGQNCQKPLTEILCILVQNLEMNRNFGFCSSEISNHTIFSLKNLYWSHFHHFTMACYYAASLPTTTRY